MVTIAPPGGAYFMAASIVSIMHAVTALLHPQLHPPPHSPSYVHLQTIDTL